MEFLGKYKIKSMYTFVDGEFKEVGMDKFIESLVASGSADESEIEMMKSMFYYVDEKFIYSFCDVPKGCSEEDLNEAIKAGEAFDTPFGFKVVQSKNEWRLNGDIYEYKTKTQAVILGEKQSPWVDAKFDGKTMVVGDGFVTLEKE